MSRSSIRRKAHQEPGETAAALIEALDLLREWEDTARWSGLGHMQRELGPRTRALLARHKEEGDG